MRLLLVEDDPMIGRAVKSGLEQGGHAIDWIADGHDALHAMATRSYELLLLDIGLPTIDGLSVLQTLRARGDPTPVLVMSARDAVADRIAGLNAGADDYLLKPFDLGELLARVQALLRRHAKAGSRLLSWGDIELDPERRTAHRGGRELALTSKEFDLLEALLARPGAVLSRERLEHAIYAWGEDVSSNAIEVHLHNLRRKLGPGVIGNLRGVGYYIGR